MRIETGEDKKGLAESLHILIRLVVVLAALGFTVEGAWIDAVLTASIFVLMLLPDFLKNRYKIQTPLELDLAITAFIFLGPFLGSFSDFYEKFSWWDTLLHFQSGLLLGIIGFLLVYILNASKTDKITMSPVFVAFFSFTFSVAIAGLWEIYEFLGDLWFGFNMQRGSLIDTMEDIIVNVIGALIVSILGFLWMKRRKKMPFSQGPF